MFSLMPTFVHPFDETLPGAPAEAGSLLGGKGASLAAMTRAGLRVPPGFTITTEACRHFYANGQQWPAELEAQIRGQLARLEEMTGRRFGRGSSPLFVSVRSGAAVSMPGMMDTILNCGIHPGLAAEAGDTPQFWRVCVQFIETFAKTVAGLELHAAEPSAERAHGLMAEFAEKTGRPFPIEPWGLLAACIDAVFRSWNSERAVAYRKRNDIRGLPGTAVNVQVMFPSRMSGVAFTQDPNNPAAQQMVIESAYGLGEAVVSGDVTPDRFVVKRDDFSAIETFRGSKGGAVSALGDTAAHDAESLTLSPAQIAELCTLCLAVERHFGRPVDIEWGWADGEFALLQSRAIPGLEIAADAELARSETVEHLRALAGKHRRVWVTHNLRETLRAPTPLTWDIVRRFMSGSGGFGLMYQDFGYRPSAEVCERGFLELICGRIYADPERLSQLFWDGLPMSYDLAAILRNKNELDRAPTKFEPAKADETLLLKLPGAIRSLFRSSRTMKRLRKSVKRTFEEEVLPQYLEYVREKRASDLMGHATPDVVKEVHERCQRVLNVFGKESLKPAFFGGLALNALETLLVQLGGEAEGARCTSTLTMALENDSTYEQDALLYRVAKGEAALDGFIAQYGHRATGEMELSEPRWREDQSYLRQVIAQIGRSHAKSMPNIHRDNLQKYHEARSALPTLLASWGGSSFAEEIEEHLAEARALLPYRETGKHYLMMGYELIRLALLELARRWEMGNDLFFLHLAELEQFETRAAELRPEIARRKIRWKSVQRFDLPDVIDSDHLDRFGMPQVFENATEWLGEPVSAGVATGTARIVFNPREVEELGTDYFLVCPSTDPGWTPLFINARGLIVERGGVLSHGAIVARDFGIPAIVCPNATKLLHSGDRLHVDGNTGKITKLATI
jgi:phosphohistidine swiveling domain-containing protein